VNRRGTVAILAALLAVPMIGAVGLAVDLTRIWLVRSRLVTAIDAAALAGARSISSATRNAESEALFWANFTRPNPAQRSGLLGATVTGPLFTPLDEATLQVSASARVPTTFLQVLGIREWTVHAQNAARRADLGMELALVLDVTGSLDVSGITAVRNSAADLVNILYGSRETVPNLRVAVVPYTASINIGPTRTGWLRAGTLDQNAYGRTGWQGCVDARRDGLDVTDDPPTTEAARFVPFLWSSTHGQTWRVGNRDYTGDNNWTTGPGGITEDDYDSDGMRARNNAVGPNLGCPRMAILPLTASRTTVLNHIAAQRFGNRGGTMGNLGLQAGWWTLSPRWRGLWGDPLTPVDHGTPLIQKVLVIMTDGQNNWYDWPGVRDQFNGAPGRADDGRVTTGNDADRTSYGRLSAQHLLPGQTITNAQGTAEIDRRFGQMCTAIKATGITIYTVAFQIDGLPTGTRTPIVNLLTTCASAPVNFFNAPTAEALRTSFREIGTQLANLRLSQ
jgi:Flp pilus assembly protein TadG